MRRISYSIVVALVCAVSARAATQAPAGEGHPSFEVTSVKVNVSGTVVLPDGRVATGTNVSSAGGRFTAQNASLFTLVSMAHGIPEFRIAGGPRWLRATRFNIEAKAQTAVNEPEMMLMLRSLLADRFGLSLHREIKEMPAHVLLLAKKGFTLLPTQADPSRRRPIRYAVSQRPAEDRPPRIQLTGTGSMEQLAAFLASSMRNPVIDGTGVEGSFDINVEFTSETFVLGMKGGERDASIGVTSALVPPDPELATALRVQLGLRIETQRRPVEVLVVEGATVPSEN